MFGRAAAAFLLLTAISASGQLSETVPERIHYVKGNALLFPALLLNFGLESQMSEKITWQNDFFISPWKSVNGNHAMALMIHTEGRYYLKEAFRHWYFGVNTGTGIFDVTKWNHSGMHRFQRGFNFMLGVTAGYQFQWKERWNIDIFAGGGTVQSFYHGYAETDDPPGFYRYDDAEKWNKSGEFLPYRGGVMISYRLNK